MSNGAKVLTENHWKDVSRRYEVDSDDLLKAVAAYHAIEEHEHEERLEAIALMNRHAIDLKKEKEIDPAVIKQLAELLAVLQKEQREIAQAKAAEAKENVVLKKKEEEQKKREQEAEEDADQGDYPVKLMTALNKLRSAKDLSYPFILCEGKPFWHVMLAKQITAKQKTELIQMPGASKRLFYGRCHFENGKFNFTMEKPITGLARKLQDSIKNVTGKKLPILSGTESADADEEKPATGQQPQAGAAAKAVHLSPKMIQLSKAPDIWHQTRKTVETRVDQLKKAIRTQFADEGPELVGEIDQNMKKLDWILDTLDHKLADSLAKAHAANDEAARKAELNNSKAILTKYIKYVATEPMIKHIDTNPFGVKTDLEQLLKSSLGEMAKAI